MNMNMNMNMNMYVNANANANANANRAISDTNVVQNLTIFSFVMACS